MGILKTLAVAAIGFVLVFAVANGIGTSVAPHTSSALSRTGPTSISPSRTNDVAKRPDAPARYHSCVSGVETTYRNSWKNACDDVAARSVKQRNDCMARGGGWEVCSRITIQDGGADCMLPVNLASELTAILEKGRDRCLQEVNAGLR
jgi:hypothetical protein